MSVRRVKAGTANVSVVIRIVDSSDGTPETGVTSATTGLDLWYRREGAASVDITESDLSALTDAHSDGGMLHINDGWYRVDYPDAAFAASATGVQIGGTATGMVVLAPYFELVAYDPYDTVRLGLTALPNAAADAAGGLPISDAGGLDLDTLDSNVAAVLVDTGTTLDGKIDTIDGIVDTILLDTNELQSDDVPGLIAALNNLSTSDVKTQADSAISDAFDFTSNLVQADMQAIDASTTAATRHALAAAQIVSGSATGDTLSTTQMSTGLDEATDDHYNGRIIIWTSGVLAGQATDITDYEGSSKTLTFTTITEAPSEGDSFVIV